MQQISLPTPLEVYYNEILLYFARPDAQHFFLSFFFFPHSHCNSYSLIQITVYFLRYHWEIDRVFVSAMIQQPFLQAVANVISIERNRSHSYCRHYHTFSALLLL